MLKLSILLASLLMTAQFALASETGKTGQVLLDGISHTVTIHASDENNLGPNLGTILLDQQQFQISSSGTNGITANYRLTENNVATKDLTLMIQFKDMSSPSEQAETQSSLKDSVDNPSEVQCGPDSNAVVLLGDNLSNKVYGNCAKF
jgi:hypothetical protein